MYVFPFSQGYFFYDFADTWINGGLSVFWEVVLHHWAVSLLDKITDDFLDRA